MKSYTRRSFIKATAITAASSGAVPGLGAYLSGSPEPGGSTPPDMAAGGGLREKFANPPREFGLFPIWFWDEDPEEKEIRRQLGEFHKMGFAGVLPMWCAGWSGRIGYMTPGWFRLIGCALDEAARLGMKMVLWDEGGYPSGSAHGLVARENPGHLIHHLVPVDCPLKGPATGYWLPSPGQAVNDRMLHAYVARKEDSGALDPATLRSLEILEHGLVRYEVGPGDWQLISVWDTESGASTRGLTPQEEDDRAFAPPAASIIDPGAVDSFIRHSHEQYYARFKQYFGGTIIGFWTDEPTTYARGSRWPGRAPVPFHSELPGDVRREWDEDVRQWWPALWFDCGPRTEAFRLAFDHALQKRVSRVYYARVSRWCEDHGVVLCGHPANDGDLAPLRLYQLPGQDLVHNYVAPAGREPAETERSVGREERPWGVWRVGPETPSALFGPHSVTAKSASSAAMLDGRRRNSSQFGSYGWKMTLDEVKWLFDWHLVRGTNFFFISSCYYSVRGRRVHIWDGPCMGAHNVWWPYFGGVAAYAHRLSWLLADGRTVCDIAVLTDPFFLRWEAAAELFRAQAGFFYLYDEPLLEARISGDRLVIGQASFRAVVCNLVGAVAPMVRAKLEEFRAAGGVVVETWTPGTLASRLVPNLGQDLRVEGPPARELRVNHYRKGGWDFYLLVNEGNEMIERRISLSTTGALEIWDPLDGSARPWPGRVVEGRLESRVRLEQRQGLVLAVDPRGRPDPSLAYPPEPGAVVLSVSSPWNATDIEGKAVDAPCPGDWARERAWELFSGTLCFHTVVELTAALAREPLFLDLGRVCDIAEVRLNGKSLGVRAWGPGVLPVGQAARPGANALEVRVTNSMANSIQGRQLPSGLLGPVCLRSGVPSRL